MKFVLVIDRKLLFPGLSPQGFLPLETIDLDVVDEHGFFAERDYMERCSHFKQLIPYITLTHGGHVLAYQRQAKHSEQRLGGKWTVGFGGHIEPMDRTEAKGGLLHAAALREFEEETGFTVSSDALVEHGCINSESEDVSSVHVGVFFTVALDGLDLDADGIAAKVTAQAEPYRVQWVERSALDLDEAPSEGQWEDWTRIVIPALS